MTYSPSSEGPRHPSTGSINTETESHLEWNSFYSFVAEVKSYQEDLEVMNWWGPGAKTVRTVLAVRGSCGMYLPS
jgi:hypothetical protein